MRTAIRPVATPSTDEIAGRPPILSMHSKAANKNASAREAVKFDDRVNLGAANDFRIQNKRRPPLRLNALFVRCVGSAMGRPVYDCILSQRTPQGNPAAAGDLELCETLNSAARVDRYARHGRELMGCRFSLRNQSPVRKRESLSRQYATCPAGMEV